MAKPNCSVGPSIATQNFSALEQIKSKMSQVSSCFRDKQYVFDFQEASHTVAQGRCISRHDGILAVLDDIETNAFVSSFISNVASTGEVWIGLQLTVPRVSGDLRNPLNYQFSDGSRIVAGGFASQSEVFPWGSLAPSAFAGSDCVVVGGQDRGTSWSGRVCDEPFPFVCQQACTQNQVEESSSENDSDALSTAGFVVGFLGLVMMVVGIAFFVKSKRANIAASSKQEALDGNKTPNYGNSVDNPRFTGGNTV